MTLCSFRKYLVNSMLSGSLDFRAEHPQACHAMSVTVALATVRWHVQFKLCCVMHSVFHRMCPAYLSNMSPSVQAVHVSDYIPPWQRTFHCHGCAQSSVNVHFLSFSHAGPSAWNDLPEDLRRWQTQQSSDSSWRLTFLLELLMFSDLRPSFLMFYRTHVMHLCSDCNRRTRNS